MSNKYRNSKYSKYKNTNIRFNPKLCATPNWLKRPVVLVNPKS